MGFGDGPNPGARPMAGSTGIFNPPGLQASGGARGPPAPRKRGPGEPTEAGGALFKEGKRVPPWGFFGHGPFKEGGLRQPKRKGQPPKGWARKTAGPGAIPKRKNSAPLFSPGGNWRFWGGEIFPGGGPLNPIPFLATHSKRAPGLAHKKGPQQRGPSGPAKGEAFFNAGGQFPPLKKGEGVLRGEKGGRFWGTHPNLRFRKGGGRKFFGVLRGEKPLYWLSGKRGGRWKRGLAEKGGKGG